MDLDSIESRNWLRHRGSDGGYFVRSAASCFQGLVGAVSDSGHDVDGIVALPEYCLC